LEAGPRSNPYVPCAIRAGKEGRGTVKVYPWWLPAGYLLDEDTAVLYLLREADGSTVAVFSTLAASREEILEAALEDLRG